MADRPASLSGDTARRWWRLAAALLVWLVAAGVGYDLMKLPPTYLESATVMFSLPKSESAANDYYTYAIPLITSAQAMVQELTGPRARSQIRAAGGSARVDLQLVNLYSEQYPDYGVPLATLTAASPSAENVHSTFAIAARRVVSLLATRQAKAGVARRDRISAEIIADTGPLIQTGSAKRVMAGLAALALMAVAGLWSVIDSKKRSKAPTRLDVTVWPRARPGEAVSRPGHYLT